MRTRGGSLLVILVGSISVAAVGAAPVGAVQPDPAIADAGLVVQTDLPAGYAPTQEDDESSGLDQAAKRIPACRTLAALGKATKQSEAKPTKAESPDFEAQSGQVTSETSVYASESDAIAVEAMLEEPRLQRCLNPLMTTAMREAMVDAAKELPKRQRKAAQRVDIDIDVVPSRGTADDQITYRVTILLGLLQGVPMYTDVVFLREGRALGFYTFLNVGSPPTTPDTVLPAVVARMAAAQV